MHIPIICVTGTKGKTTTVAIIHDILRALGKNTLKVDTTGHFINGQRRSTLDDSKETWRLVPSVCPGRYLWEFHADPNLRNNGVAILESSLGSSSLSGMGYSYHDVGVFLNVFEDHLGSSERIKSRADIAEAKEFIFKRLTKNNGYAVFNADDKLVCEQLKKLPGDIKCDHILIPCGIDFSHFDLKQHLDTGGVVITMNEKNEIIMRSSQQNIIIANLKNIPWAFDGRYLPSVWNIMLATAAVYGHLNGKLPENIREIVESVRLDPYGGRMTLLENAKGVKIIADYAHEKKSLATVAALAKSLIDINGSVIGVVRLAYDRTDELLHETGRVIGEAYDSVVVYDKIDGFFRKAKEKPQSARFQQVEGRTSQVVYDGVKQTNENVRRIVREDQAIKYAAEIAKAGDIVVIIVNDNIPQSIELIKKYFKADFI